MDKPVAIGELIEPRFFQEGYAYIGQDENWYIKEDAPEWVKQEFKEFFKLVKAEPNESWIVTHF